jgi:ADP-ribose pyrophosphatase YjhB (NUDIX family)
LAHIKRYFTTFIEGYLKPFLLSNEGVNNMTHNLAAGVIVIQDDKVLLVRDDSGWTLPRGSTENGESFEETARREGIEETGYKIDVQEVAFVTEFKTKKYGQYLQVYYSGTIISKAEPPDGNEIFEIKFVPINELRNFLKARPQIIPLEVWIKEKVISYYNFNLDEEGFESGE